MTGRARSIKSYSMNSRDSEAFERKRCVLHDPSSGICALASCMPSSNSRSSTTSAPRDANAKKTRLRSLCVCSVAAYGQSLYTTCGF